MRLPHASVFLALFACGAPQPAARADGSLAALLERWPGQVIGVVMHDLASDRRVEANADVVFHAASTMKVAVLVELHRQHADGRVPPAATMVVRNEFSSIADGSIYRLAAGDDTDPDLYSQIGKPVTVRELADRMIARSSNLATNLLLERIGVDNVQRTLAELGCGDLRVLRGVEDQRAFERGVVNTTTARSLARLFVRIARREAAPPVACAAMIAVLLGQADRAAIPAGLPPATPVANKTGEITAIRHDAAIVDPNGPSPWVLVVLTRGFADAADANRAIAEITRWFARQRERS